MIASLTVVLLLLLAAFSGYRRGPLLAALELVTFSIATVLSLLTYHLLGAPIKSVSGVSLALGNIVAFVIIWIVSEIACAIAIRKWVLPRYVHPPNGPGLTRPHRTGGALLSVVQCLIVVSLLLAVFASLPLSSTTKRAVTAAPIPKQILASTSWLNPFTAGIGHDVSESFNFFTITTSPESEQRVTLGYTTTGTLDPADETAMLILLNHERTSRGLDPLTLNTGARSVARKYSADMFARGYFSHINPEGKTPFDRLHDAHVNFGSAGENLALAPNLQLAHQGLMHSPGHRANILSKAYRSVGIGIIDGGPYGLMITQDFTD